MAAISVHLKTLVYPRVATSDVMQVLDLRDLYVDNVWKQGSGQVLTHSVQVRSDLRWEVNTSLEELLRH